MTQEEDYCEQRSRENLVNTYREELLRIIDGQNCVKLLPFRVRKRMRNDGIIRKFGTRYLVTELGIKMIGEEREEE